MARLILIAATLLALCIPGVGQRPLLGTITGTVFGQAGEPVEGATAYALNVDGVSGMIPKGITDRTGHFVIRRLQFGRYTVSAGKPDAGYPPLHESFYAGFDTPQPEVFLDADNSFATVALRLGKHGGWLTGSVRDNATGNLIEACSEFRWKSNPRIFLGGAGAVSGAFRILLPSDTPVTLKVWTWGYDPWIYHSPEAKALKPRMIFRWDRDRNSASRYVSNEANLRDNLPKPS
jgi:hypothetical protein